MRVAQRRREPGRLIVARPVLFLSIAIGGVAGAGCGTPGTLSDELSIEAHITPPSLVVGHATLAEVKLRDAAGRPVRGATLQVEGHMSHPGMAPVIAAAVEQPDGGYLARLTPGMTGEWAFLISGALPDGTRIRTEIGKREVTSAPGG